MHDPSNISRPSSNFPVEYGDKRRTQIHVETSPFPTATSVFENPNKSKETHNEQGKGLSQNEPPPLSLSPISSPSARSDESIDESVVAAMLRNLDYGSSTGQDNATSQENLHKRPADSDKPIHVHNKKSRISGSLVPNKEQPFGINRSVAASDQRLTGQVTTWESHSQVLPTTPALHSQVSIIPPDFPYSNQLVPGTTTEPAFTPSTSIPLPRVTGAGTWPRISHRAILSHHQVSGTVVQPGVPHRLPIPLYQVPGTVVQPAVPHYHYPLPHNHIPMHDVQGINTFVPPLPPFQIQMPVGNIRIISCRAPYPNGQQYQSFRRQ